ncbi:hypothetical protein ARC20_09850 [Stenotrophomonas panacihumi]|uniref:DUF2272 domain-containing protein n=1 Tax=Stenotrophomonas panacihumi TaxID=676599 RepID=A0A0R0AEV3_9GAMM|nr:DUF2272 domain-containing protein [Stenotrophomonas panacihumi]KRG43343.1 hypothetical protein ARC20_09850 [Stenotrophomonas panacihumi]PTN55031.1 DUF2272 domain-containing protein [Stenotrophomonas panacihumi]
MKFHALIRCSLALLLLACGHAAAAEICDLPPRYGLSAAAMSIVRTACNEHRAWNQPFIDTQGRVASLSLTEAERGELSYGGMSAWMRVASYWRDSGLLQSVADRPGARSCMAPDGSRWSEVDCRAFLIDTPWSAAFVSWVMARAGVAGFHASARHLDYIRAAYRAQDGDAYTFTDPENSKPEPGDLLCLLRGRDDVVGFAGLSAALSRTGAVGWPSHCDIVIAANVGGDRTLYLIGGNVFNTVMMRKLPLDRTGRLVLPKPLATGDGSEDGVGVALDCSPARESQCDLNRRDWAALLKLRPTARLIAPPPQALPTVTPTTPTQTPMPPGFPRVVPPRPVQQPVPATPVEPDKPIKPL